MKIFCIFSNYIEFSWTYIYISLISNIIYSNPIIMKNTLEENCFSFAQVKLDLFKCAASKLINYAVWHFTHSICTAFHQLFYLIDLYKYVGEFVFKIQLQSSTLCHNVELYRLLSDFLAIINILSKS